jgi:16S rRNA (adenine1518-N6/adenine1519-N6)-dimethyltransferase
MICKTSVESNLSLEFSYNISTQIVFRTLEYRNQIPEFSGMFQKEVAQRICERREQKPTEYYLFWCRHFMMLSICLLLTKLFLFRHQVKSGVLRLRRKADYSLPCGEKLFSQ